MSPTRIRAAGFFPAAATALALTAFFGCASSTVIHSQPPGARVLINGAPAGNTPYTMTDSKTVGSTTQIRLEHDGYHPLDTTISRNEELDMGALIGGFFALVPFLWVMKYKPSRVYQLAPLQAVAAQNPAPPSAATPATTIGPAGYPVPPPGYPPTAP